MVAGVFDEMVVVAESWGRVAASSRVVNDELAWIQLRHFPTITCCAQLAAFSWHLTPPSTLWMRVLIKLEVVNPSSIYVVLSCFPALSPRYAIHKVKNNHFAEQDIHFENVAEAIEVEQLTNTG
jgi:hypothetical protein